MYENAKKNSLEFELKNNGLTTCDRPYSRRNQSIFELRNENNPSNLVYVESEDTTTATTAAVSPQQKTIKEVTDDIFGMLSNTSWSPVGGLGFKE
jgi:hypothetical protein